MKHILITGMSGVGKSSALETLRNRGYHCIEMDDPGWSFMDEDGHQHWIIDRLSAALDTSNNGPVFVAGCAEEQSQLHDKFCAVILLSAPLEVMKERISNRDNNSYGKRADEMELIESNLCNIEPVLRRSCTHEIITTCPLNIVVDRIETIAAEQGASPDAFGAGEL